MTTTLAVDGMGGDSAPSIVIEGIELFIQAVPDVHFLLYGDSSSIQPLLRENIKPYITFIPTEQWVTNDTKPAAAVRMGRKTSMGQAIQAVAEGRADAVVSAGNTGAYMALSKILLKTFNGIDRPAIPGIIPSNIGTTLVLDIGANIECSPEHLVQFAVMGSIYAKKLLGIENPTVGLLNVGAEELKGNQVVQKAAQFLKEHPLVNFYGFVEGDDIAKGTTQVVVTDGFTGNILLKTIEGTVRFFTSALKNSLKKSFTGRLGALLAKSSLQAFKRFGDPRIYNGAVFLGLQGIAVKSHGGTDGFGFSKALHVAYNMVQRNIIADVKAGLEGIH